jgi:hypothetical protein
MQRQCAWCLRIMNNLGERISLQPVPKLYEASHGMCLICGMYWLAQAMCDTEEQPALVPVLRAKELTYRC